MKDSVIELIKNSVQQVAAFQRGRRRMQKLDLRGWTKRDPGLQVSQSADGHTSAIFRPPLSAN